MQHNRRILIVDDQQDLREQLAKLLLRSGHNNETSSLVQGMRARLGMKENADAGSKNNVEIEYEVDTVGQGEDAFKLVQRSLENKRPYAMMFTDMRMPPGWDGLETAKRVREVDKNIEIVIMTAFADHDQKKVADTIGTPHKLLYIKKPFQSEEISQLALALTSKWNFEETERIRKEWLETLIRCLGKVKTSTGGGIEDVFASILKSLLSFCSSGKGFIAACSDTGAWEVKSMAGAEKPEIEEFIKANADRLKESRTTLSVDNKYILPLRRDASGFYVAGIYDLDMQNDPEWYKMLSLLVMTAGEVLNTALLNSSSIRKEQITTLTRAVNKISMLETDAYVNIRGALAEIETRLPGDPAVAKIRETVNVAEKRLARINDVLLLGDGSHSSNSPGVASRIDEIVRRAGDEASAMCGNFKIDLQVTGDSVLQTDIPADMLQRAFRNLAMNSCEACQGVGRSQVTIKVEIKDLKNAAGVTFNDDGPGIAEKVKGEFFEPFVSSNDKKLGIGLAAARLILERFRGTIFFDVKNTASGATFNIKLPLASK